MPYNFTIEWRKFFKHTQPIMKTKQNQKKKRAEKFQKFEKDKKPWKNHQERETKKSKNLAKTSTRTVDGSVTTEKRTI